MKTLLILALALSASYASAGEPKAALFRDLAITTVNTMEGRAGDAIDAFLTEMNHTETSVQETWRVEVTNGEHRGGSATYEVNVTQKNGESSPGEEMASVRVRYMGGN